MNGLLTYLQRGRTSRRTGQATPMVLAGIFVVSVAAGVVLSTAIGGNNPFGGPAADSPPNVIIIDIDMLSASRLSCYGHHRNTTPHLCRFADDSIRFTDAIAPSGFTASSVGSLFTGQYPRVHGLLNFGDHLPNESTTLAETLSREGYATAAFPSVPNNHPKFLVRDYNLDQGFDTYNRGNLTLSTQIDNMVPWLEGRPDGPFFLYIQGYDPHRYLQLGSDHATPRVFRDEYTGTLHNLPPPAENKTAADIVLVDGQYRIPLDNGSDIILEQEDIEHIKDVYDDRIRWTDDNIDDLLTVLREKDVYTDSIIIVTANHGEMMDTKTFENNNRFGHGSVWDGIVNIPLAMKVPGIRPQVIGRQVELLDIFPTLMEEIGIRTDDDLDDRLQGQSFRPLYSGEGRYTKDAAFITDYDGFDHAIRNETWKLVTFPDRDELYHLKKDPNETDNVLDQRTGVAADLEARLSRQELRNNLMRSKYYGTDEERSNRTANTHWQTEVSPKPVRWWRNSDNLPFQVPKSDFCQDAKITMGQTISPEFRVCLNEHGFRSPSYAAEKPDDVVRVVALGDAVTFGIGVDNNETWPAFLERNLNRRAIPDAPRVQVMNVGLPFATTREEVMWFEQVGPKFDPDLVVMQYMENDAENLTRIDQLHQQTVDSLPDSMSLERKNRIASVEAIQQERRERLRMPIKEEMEMVEPFFSRLDTLSHQSGFDVAVKYFATHSSRRHISYIRNTTRERGWTFMVSDLANRSNVSSPYTFPDTFYMTPAGHNRTALQVAEKLRTTGLLPVTDDEGR